MNRYTITCLWRPPKDLWPNHGAQWRLVTVVLESADRPEHAACDACLYLIAMRRGQAKAVSVLSSANRKELMLFHIHFNWIWYSGVVTWGARIVEVIPAI
ncbi:MAG TPA: hypothetical protein PKJ19_16165 [Flavobacteriales bacterium]|nr:hypothetical protein [Flavobacteriales bacterium]